MKILVTGGAGYIGSHTCVELLEAGYDVVVVDNLYNASPKVIGRIKEITGKDVTFYEKDIRDLDAMNEIFAKEKPDTVIHFAGLKAVGESVRKPLEYYENNIAGTLTLCKAMRENGFKNIIFSSSATVYGNPAFIPITEECPKGVCTNPYGWTKHMLEQILTDIHTADPEWNVILLRYFNPIGAHKSGQIKKGDVLAVAQVAGIMAAKQTSAIIPMCHPLMLSGIDIHFETDTEENAVHIKASVKTTGQTGVEMEALHAVSAAALTIYDMCKAIDRGMHITNLRVIEKDGGKSGHFTQQ